jgi:ribose 5-phosphate isomerase B
MKIAIGADHRGFLHKEYIKKHMTDIEWLDVGTENLLRTDYPVFAHKAIEQMRNNQQDIAYAILLCGTGNGMAIVANRYKNMYAAVAWNAEVARRCKQEDNANILVLPCDYISHEDGIVLIGEWLRQDFKGGRYAQRIAMIDQ